MKVKLENRKETENDFGQKTITGIMNLSEDIRMRNKENDGKYPGSKKWVDPVFITVKKGTKVNYRGFETRTGFVHTVYVKTKDGFFACNKIEVK